MRKITSPNAQNHAQLTVGVSTLKSVNVEIAMSKKQSKKHSSKQKDGNHSQEQKRKLKPVDPEYEEWLDELDEERHSNEYVERRKSKRYKVDLKGVLLWK